MIYLKLTHSSSLLHSRAVLVKSSAQGYRHASIWYRHIWAPCCRYSRLGSASVTRGGGQTCPITSVCHHSDLVFQMWHIYSKRVLIGWIQVCKILLMCLTTRGRAGLREGHCLIRALNYTHDVLSLKAQEVWRDLGCGRRTWGLFNSTTEV